MRQMLRNIRSQLAATVASRTFAAYVMMAAFIIATSVGVAMIYPPAGLITLGLTCGFVGYLLGAE